MGTDTDRSLVARASLGDLDAFDSIVRSRMDAVYRLSLAILGSEADARDATQEAFVSAWRQMPQLRDVDRFDAWLQRIAVNAARMAARARGRRRVREVRIDTMVDGASDLDTSDAERLRTALTALTTDQRTILALHHLDRRPIAELAEILEIPEGTVKSRLFAARRALNAALASEDPT